MQGSLFHLIPLLFIFFSSINAYNLVGLKNYGETCYANVIFQLLYRNKDFRHSLNKYLLINRNSNLQTLQDIFHKMNMAPVGSTVNPDTFNALPDSFIPGVQYDVAEVLAKYQEIPNFDWNPFALKLQDTLSNPSNIFAVEFDLELELLINVPKNEPVCLHDLLVLHFRNFIIQSISNNLIVRIKRLRNVNGIDEKITTKISIPETISLQNFSNPETTISSSQFQLDSFIEHCGKCSDGGHYLFFFHEKKTDEYFVINDENIQKITKGVFLERASQAYLFLYRQLVQ